MESLPLELIVHIFNFLPFKGMIKNILVSKNWYNTITQIHWKMPNFLIVQKQDYEILFKFKPKIKKLIISTVIPKLNLTEIKYEHLYFINMDFNEFSSIEKIDSKISTKCRKITFHYNKKFTECFISSFGNLQNCETMYLHDSSILCNRYNRDILSLLKMLPRLRKISLTFWYLNNDYLASLSDHEIIILTCVYINGDLELIHNYSELRIKSCFFGTPFGYETRSLVYKGNYIKK